MHPKVRGFGLENNGPFWADHITRVFLPYIRVLREVYFKRLAPTFDDANVDADRVSEEVWRQLGEAASSEADPGDLAEIAHHAGIDRYLMLSDARQTLNNLYAVALHHLLEQQQIVLLRRELLAKEDEHESALHNRDRFVAELRAQGIDPTSYASWKALDDLRLVANSVKHADGPSVVALKQRRPEMFTHPFLRNDPDSLARDSALLEFHRVYQPLAGDDLYVTDDELSQFFDAAEQFWTELARDFYRVARFDRS
jgi:hypothetical protein